MIPRKYAINGLCFSLGVMLCIGFISLMDGHFLDRRQLFTAFFVALVGACVFLGRWKMEPAPSSLVGHERLVTLRSIRWPQYQFYAGRPEQYAKHFRRQMHLPERIVLTATRHANGNLYGVERPGRHPHVLQVMHEQGLSGKHAEHEQGFITNHGRFVSREEGVVIAATAGQLIKKTNPVQELFSEDLWTTPPEYYGPALQTRMITFDDENPRPYIEATLVPMDMLQEGSPTILDRPCSVSWHGGVHAEETYVEEARFKEGAFKSDPMKSMAVHLAFSHAAEESQQDAPLQ